MSLLVVSGCLAPVGFSDGVDRTTTETVADGTTGASAATVPSTATDGGEEPTRANESVNPGDKESQPDALESSLHGLVVADNRSAFAERRGWAYRNESIEVVVELREGRSLPEGFDLTVESSYEQLVQAEVAIDDLIALSEHENVTFVRPPRRPSTGLSSPAFIDQPSSHTPTDDS